MSETITIARREIEERYGPIGDGKKILFVNGVSLPRCAFRAWLAACACAARPG